MISYLSAHHNAIFTRGRILLSYCAWPVPNGFKKRTVFASLKGYLYDWEKLPFDWPASAQMWNFWLENGMNRQHPYAFFWNSSFVICANDTADAVAKSASILAEAHKQGVDLELDQPESWVEDVDELTSGRSGQASILRDTKRSDTLRTSDMLDLEHDSVSVIKRHRTRQRPAIWASADCVRKVLNIFKGAAVDMYSCNVIGINFLNEATD